MDRFATAAVCPHGFWSEMDADVLGLVFAKLPETFVLRAASVCKRWQSVAQEPSFTKLYANQEKSTKAFHFLVNGVKYAFSKQSKGFSFQSVDNCYDAPTISCVEDGEIPSNEATGGLHYAFTGHNQNTVQYKLCLLEKNWRKTSEIPYQMQDPIVGVVKGGEFGDSHKLVFAGGVDYFLADVDDTSVSIYDAQANSWEACEPLPYEFRDNASSLLMSSLVHNGKFYAYDTYAGYVSSLDLESKQWSAVQLLCPTNNVNQLFLASQAERLYLVGIHNANEKDLRFTVWDVDEDTMQVRDLLDSTTILDGRASSLGPSTIMSWASTSLDPFSTVSALIIFFLINFLMLWHTVTSRTIDRIKGIVTSANFPSICHLGTSWTSRLNQSLLSSAKFHFTSWSAQLRLSVSKVEDNFRLLLEWFDGISLKWHKTGVHVLDLPARKPIVHDH